MLATEHTLLRRFLNIWRQILFPRDLQNAVLWNFWTIEIGTFNCASSLHAAPSTLEQVLTVVYARGDFKKFRQGARFTFLGMKFGQRVHAIERILFLKQLFLKLIF